MEGVDVVTQINVPHWLLWSAFLGGFTLTGLQVIKFFYHVFNPVSVDLRLTRELFFRLTDWGECLFPNIVLIARNGEVEIKDICFELKKTKSTESTSEKSYNVNPLHFGERAKGDGPFSENNFYTKSPIFFVPQANPLRLVIMAVLEGYVDEVKDLVQDFNFKIDELKQEYIKIKTEDDGDKDKEYLIKLNSVITDYTAKTLDKVQLEFGEYTLKCVVKYKPLRLWASEKMSTSTISFRVDKQVRDEYRIKLERLFKQSATNWITETQGIINYPEYNPHEVREVN